MNVLILTPDAVGSTLLQRLITIYMQFHQYDRPVINLHELTNGLIKYYNKTFDQEVLGKKDGAWGYHQSLQQIVELITSADHYKTSRLAHYHIRNRQDSIADQIAFYQYLNDNFYIISCRRHNLFEHALSWCLTKVTKKLNVYTGQEKIDSFFDLYSSGIEIDPNSLLNTLESYKNYMKWCNDHFDVANYFYYEEHLPRIENYILNLPIFPAQQPRVTWKQNFGLEFDQWNMYHYLTSDIGTLALNSPDQFATLHKQAKKIPVDQIQQQLLSAYNDVKDSSWPELKSLEDYKKLPQHIRQEIESTHGITVSQESNIVIKTELSRPLVEILPEAHRRFIDQYQTRYNTSMTQINQMVKQRIMINNPPIKKQTLAEKKHIVRNYKNLLAVYNRWIEQNPNLGNPLQDEILDQFAKIESNQWNPEKSALISAYQQNSY